MSSNLDYQPRPSTLQSYLQLVRLPNLFTAMADVAMGFLFVEADWAWHDRITLLPVGTWVLGLLIAGSTLLYAAGVVLNDLFDLETDRRERPDRPLPSGRVSVRAARWLGWEMLLVGTVLPCLVALLLNQFPPAQVADPMIAWRPVNVAVLLAMAIVLYNAVLKRTWLGPLAMGWCRMLNVLLGMSVLRVPLTAQHWLVAGAIGVYVMGISWFARDEAERSRRLPLVLGTVLMAGGVAMLARVNHYVPAKWLDPNWWCVAMAWFGCLTVGRCFWAIVEPEPGRVQYAVGRAILSLVILDAAACFLVRGPSWALFVLLLMAPAMFLGRWISPT